MRSIGYKILPLVEAPPFNPLPCLESSARLLLAARIASIAFFLELPSRLGMSASACF
jgi:hypothetical protein